MHNFGIKDQHGIELKRFSLSLKKKKIDDFNYFFKSIYCVFGIPEENGN